MLNWKLPGAKNHLLDEFVGGWSVSPILYVTSGQPYTILNGTDRDLDGTSASDRPNIGNVNAPVNTRGVVTAACASGYYDPGVNTTAALGCVNPSQVHWLQVTTYQPTSPTMESRNAVFTTRYLDLDLAVLKKFAITERFKAELRGEAFNVTNNQNFTTPSAPSNVTTLNGSNFQNFLLNNGGSRTFRVAGKILY